MKPTAFRRTSISLIFLLPLIWIGFAAAQDTDIDHWESVVYASDTWRYSQSFSEPPANWRTADFNDEIWTQGPGGIGFGDNDDATIISPSIGLFMRTQFNIVDFDHIVSGMFHIDYDDSFVAYINGTEIARAGISGNPPAFDQVSDSQHEAEMFSGGSPAAFPLDSQLIKNSLKQGENILAIEVHNASATSSDMSAIPFLSFGLSDPANHYRPLPDWFQEPIVYDSSNLPIFIITTDGGQGIRDEPKIGAHLGVIYNGEGLRNNLSDPFTHYDGRIGIEYRGNATQSFPKKPYAFETRNELGENLNFPMLGLPKENDWILRAAWIDKTFLRDALAFHMSRKMGRWASHTIPVELIINGEYQGIYILEERIKPDKNRVNIARLDSSDIEGDAVTGGYIYEVAQSGPEFGERRRFKWPKGAEIMPQQAEYIRKYDDDFRAVMESNYYDDPEIGYPAWIEVDYFIDEILVQEACKNSDMYGWSSYFHKDRLGKLRAGPAWDFDQSLSNSTFNDGANYEEWITEKSKYDSHLQSNYPPFWLKLWEEPDFKAQLKKRYADLRKGPWKTDSLLQFIDEGAAWLNEAQARNFERWPILGQEIWRSTPGAGSRDTYQKEVDYLKDFVVNRLNWMDIQLEVGVDPIDPDPQEGLVAYYKFDENAGGIVNDYSGNNLNGQIAGGSSWTEGKYGAGLLLNGENAYVNCGSEEAFDFSEKITLMAWVKSMDLGNGEHNPWIAKGDHSWALKEHTSGDLEFFIYDGGWNSGRSALDASFKNEWHHFAGVFDSRQIKIYIDGALDSQTDFVGSIASSANEIHLGHNSEATDRYFNGVLDEVRIYNIALDGATIKEIFENENADIDNVNLSLTKEYILEQNYPNPFNPVTKIAYSLPGTEMVKIKIFDVLGKEIQTLLHQEQTAGLHSVTFEANGLASGIYFYQIQVGNHFSESRKMLLMK